MILRPGTDAELIECARAILSDGSAPLDVRAMVALLILDRRVRVCPTKTGIAKLLAGLFKPASAERLTRMVRDAESAGYFVPSCGRLEGRPGRRWRYWFVVKAERAQ
jgi:hypothetical protein